MLTWEKKDNEDLQFPEHYWKHIINHFNQFSQGRHSVTKAYEHYIGFVDDYSFCWGPHEEGEPLPKEKHEYSERLWGIYTSIDEDIYLLKSNEDFTSWEIEDRLVFAPTGSKNAHIIFENTGHYLIVVEITPAGGNSGVWIMEYPYEGTNIRRITDGKSPVVFKDFWGIIYIAYQSIHDEKQINCVSSEDNYTTEHVLIKDTDRALIPIEAVSAFRGNIGFIVFIYYREDDVSPYKYILSSPCFFEEFEITAGVQEINWIKIGKIDVGIDEEVELTAGIEEITWEETIVPVETETSIDEEVELTAGIQEITWQEISHSQEEISEEVELTAGIEEILWLEVEEE